MTNNTTAALTDEQRTAIQECIDYLKPAGRDFDDLGFGESKHTRCIRTLRALLTSPRAAGLPEGWKMVPIEPTEDMIVDGFESWPDQFFSKPEVWASFEKMSGCARAAHKAKLCYAAMLDAAPAAPVASPSIDIEQMLHDCVPGGDIVDPQLVCDSIRSWFEDRASVAAQAVAADGAAMDEPVSPYVAWRMHANGMYGVLSELIGSGAVSRDCYSDLRDRIELAVASHENMAKQYSGFQLRAAVSPATADERAANEWSDEDSGRLVRLIDALDRIVSGTTETSSDRLFAKTKPRNMTIRDAQEIARIHVSVARSILAKMDGHIGASQAAAPAEAREPECPRCNGSGEAVAYTDNGPDATEETVNCPHCNGHGTLAEAYAGVVAALEKANNEYLALCGKQYFVPADAGEAVAIVESWTNGSYHRNYKLRWLKDVEAGVTLYAAAQGAQSGKGGDRADQA